MVHAIIVYCHYRRERDKDEIHTSGKEKSEENKKDFSGKKEVTCTSVKAHQEGKVICKYFQKQIYMLKLKVNFMQLITR